MSSNRSAGVGVCSAKSSVKAPSSRFQWAPEISCNLLVAFTPSGKARRSSAAWSRCGDHSIDKKKKKKKLPFLDAGQVSKCPGLGQHTVIDQAFEELFTLLARRLTDPIEDVIANMRGSVLIDLFKYFSVY